MLTLYDCIGLTDVDEGELAAVALHEHLPVIVALEKANALLGKPWGEPAIRQMVVDEVRAMLANDHSHEGICRAMEMTSRVYQHHPGGHDRRAASR